MRDKNAEIVEEIVIAEVRTWASRIGVEDRLKEIRIRPMKRKWASVSTRGNLTLNSEILKKPASFRHKVIVHELVHLKLQHGRHNKLFKLLVKAYLQKYEIPYED